MALKRQGPDGLDHPSGSPASPVSAASSSPGARHSNICPLFSERRTSPVKMQILWAGHIGCLHSLALISRN